MTRLSILILATLLLSGCIIPRTQTEVPAFSGTVVDSGSGLPLVDVRIEERAKPAPKGWTAQTVVTGTDGRFSYAAITSGTVFVFPVSGAGWPISRSLLLHKEGYHDQFCTAYNKSLFGKDNRGTIPMLAINGPEPPGDKSPLIQLDDGDGATFCEAYIGSRVIYQDKSYMIDEILPPKQDWNEVRFALRPAPPNEGEVVMNVPEYRIRLVAPNPK